MVTINVLWMRSPSWLLVQGACVFLAGNALQCWSHCILANLCKGASPDAIKEEDFYQIPQGTYVSSMHNTTRSTVHLRILVDTALLDNALVSQMQREPTI